MTPITDIHTHHLRHNAIVAVTPDLPRPDGYLYSIGLHPWHITLQLLPAQLDSLTQIAESSPAIVAIGETGIDRLRGPQIELQIQAFQSHIRLSEQLRKPLIIHCVRALDIILNLHATHRPRSPWIIHGFRLGPAAARQLLDRGLFISLGPRFNPDTARTIPADRLLIETDDDPTATIDTVAAAVATARSTTPAQILDLSASTISHLFPTHLSDTR